MQNLDFEVVSKTNHLKAIEIQNLIFPKENGKNDILESLKRKKTNYKYLKYFLMKIKNQYVGISGIYVYNEYPKDGWVAWFGVLPDFRRKGIGLQTICFLKEKAKKIGLKSLRLYTDSILYKSAEPLYDKCFEHKEIYDNIQDKHFQVGDTLIYSSSLTKHNVEPWKNKNLFLGPHDDRKNM